MLNFMQEKTRVEKNRCETHQEMECFHFRSTKVENKSNYYMQEIGICYFNNRPLR